MDARPFSLDTNGFFDHLIGERGISVERVNKVAPHVAAIVADLAERRRRGDLPFYDLPRDQELISRSREVARRISDNHDTLMVLGIGGSALGTKAVLEGTAAERAANRDQGLVVEVLDNIDPLRLGCLLDRLDPTKTAVNVISKSGTTVETVAQFIIVKKWLAAAGPWQRHVVVTTDPSGGLLRQLSQNESLESLPVPVGVGGRFSVLSPVGLMPLAAAGVDIEELCAGAIQVDRTVSAGDVWANPAALHATLLWLANTEHGAAVHVLMPYSDSLLRSAEWYAQLLAESLGKRLSSDGKVVEAGQTPVAALGATDQHSQVQLYVEGPRDKVVTFIRVLDHGRRISIPSPTHELGTEVGEAISYLEGHDLGDLLNIEQRATEFALIEAGRLTSVITVERLDAATLGSLFHFFEVQTLVMGGLLAVNALDQPGVEGGKQMTSAMAGRDGYEKFADRARDILALKKESLIVG